MKKHKTGLVFALIIVVSGIFGAALGTVAMRGEANILQLGRNVDAFLRQNAVWAMGLTLLVQLGFGLLRLVQSNRAVARALAASEEDALLDRADALCDRGIGLMAVTNICSLLFLGLGCAGLSQLNGTFDTFSTLIVLVLLFAVQMGSNLFFTSRFVRLTGELYPEKRASVLSMKFQKEWFASCDEAERQHIGRAAYESMQAGQMACTFAWVVATLLAMFFEAGIIPILTVSAIFLTLTVSYLRACRKYKQAA